MSVLDVTEQALTEQALTADALPEGWTVTRLSQVTEPVPNYKPEQEPDREFCYIDIGCVSNETYSITDVKRFLGKDAPSRARRPVQPGDVLFSNVRTYLRNVVLVPESSPAALCSTGFTVLRSNAAVLPAYLFRYMLTDAFIGTVTELQTGSNYPAVTDSIVMSQTLPVPPLTEQRRIVEAVDALLERVNAAKERLAKVPQVMKHFRQSVLAAACSGRLTADWREEQPRVSGASDFGEAGMPYGWRLNVLADICTSVTDGDHLPPPQTKTGIPFAVIGNMSSGRLDLSDPRHVPPAYYEALKETRRPKRGDILYSVTGVTYGIAVKVDTDSDFCFQRHIALLRPSKDVDADYLLCALRTRDTYAQASEGVTGSAQPTLPLSALRQIRVPVAPIPEQQEIVRRVESLFSLADVIEKRLSAAAARAEKLTQAVLAKAFRGELVPTEAELARQEARPYEPAWELLERVKRSALDG